MYGVDIGYQQHAVLMWAVASTTPKLEPGALAGTYLGAGAWTRPRLASREVTQPSGRGGGRRSSRGATLE